MQAFLALIYVGGAGYLIWLIFSPGMRQDKDLAAASKALMFGASMSLVWGLLSWWSARALLQMKWWSRWMALAVNGVIATVIINGLVHDYLEHTLDPDDFPLAIALFLTCIPFFLPVVW